MIAMLAGLLGPVVGLKLARAAAWVVIVLGVIALFFGAKALYDHSIISNHDAKIEASAAKDDRKADQKAADQGAKDLARQNQEADELIKVQENAKSETDRRLAFHRCLSLQQRARANGLKPPRCV